MKKLIYCIASLLFCFYSFAASSEVSIVRKQLEDVNACWKTKTFNDEILNSRIVFSSDIERIQLHLSLVEQKLRASGSIPLTNAQKENRNKCLDVLHAYWMKGVFPKNIYHRDRTPYFIDHLGTACAVGQLIISSGNEKLAQKISKENNYAYINELNQKYPQLQLWADEHGFGIDELAWIQPTYLICDTGCVYYARVMTTRGIPPFSILWNDGDTSWNRSKLCPQQFSFIVIDSLGDTISNPLTTPSDYGTSIGAGGPGMGIPIYMPGNSVDFSGIPLLASISSTPADNNCNGTASVTASGCAGNYKYLWTPGGDTTSSISGLCEGLYRVKVSSASYSRTDSIYITKVGINEFSATSVKIFPNPSDGTLTVEFANEHNITALDIFNSTGQKVYSETSNFFSREVQLPPQPGIYFVQIRKDDQNYSSKIVIE